MASSRQIDGSRHRHSALDALRVIVSHFGSGRRQFFALVHGTGKPRHRGHPHSRAVAIAAVRLGIILHHPCAESSTIAAVRVRHSYLVHHPDKLPLEGVHIRDGPIEQQRFGHRQRHHRVVGIVAGVGKELKLLGFAVVKLKS